MADPTTRVHAGAPAFSEGAEHPCCVLPPANSAFCSSHSRGVLPASNVCTAQAVHFDKVSRGSLSAYGCAAGGCAPPEYVARNGLLKRCFSWGRPSPSRQQESMQLARALLDQYAMKCHRRVSCPRQQPAAPQLPATQAGNGNCQLLQSAESRPHFYSSMQTHTANSHCVMQQNAEVSKQRDWSYSHSGHHCSLKPARRVAPNTSTSTELNRSACCGACNAQRPETRQISSYPTRRQCLGGHRCAVPPGTLSVDGSSCLHAGRAGDGRYRNEMTDCARGNVQSHDFALQGAAPQRPSLIRLTNQESWRERCKSLSAAVPAHAGDHQCAGSYCSTEILQRTGANEDTNKQRASYPHCVCSSEVPPRYRSPVQQHGHFTGSSEAVHSTSTSGAAFPPTRAALPATAGFGTALKSSGAQNSISGGGLHFSPAEQQQQQLEMLRLQHQLLAERQARQEQQLLQQQQELRRQRLQVQWNRQAAEAEAEKRAADFEVDDYHMADEDESDQEAWLPLDETDPADSNAASLHQSTEVSPYDCDTDTEHAVCCGVYDDNRAEFDSYDDEISSDEIEKGTYSHYRTKPCKSRRRTKWFRALKTPH